MLHAVFRPHNVASRVCVSQESEFTEGPRLRCDQSNRGISWFHSLITLSPRQRTVGLGWTWWLTSQTASNIIKSHCHKKSPEPTVISPSKRLHVVCSLSSHFLQVKSLSIHAWPPWQHCHCVSIIASMRTMGVATNILAPMLESLTHFVATMIKWGATLMTCLCQSRWETRRRWLGHHEAETAPPMTKQLNGRQNHLCRAMNDKISKHEDMGAREEQESKLATWWKASNPFCGDPEHIACIEDTWTLLFGPVLASRDVNSNWVVSRLARSKFSLKTRTSACWSIPKRKQWPF